MDRAETAPVPESDPRAPVAPAGADVSVVIPTYDRAALLPEALDSVLAQTVHPAEIVVVDDGSRDATPQVLERYGDAVRPVRVIRQENRGEAAARNRGVSEAARPWIAFLDSDDRWEPHALETFLDGARRFPGAALFAPRARVLRPDGSLGRRSIGKRSPGPRFTTESLLTGDSGGVLTPMVRRDAVLDAGGFDETLRSAPDCDLWLRLSRRIEMIGLDEPLLQLRAHEGNLSGDRELNARMWLRILDKLERDEPEFVARHPGAFRRALAKEHRRLGRELLAGSGRDAARLAEARAALARSLRASPGSPRTWRWLAVAWLAPWSVGRARRAAPRPQSPSD